MRGRDIERERERGKSQRERERGARRGIKIEVEIWKEGRDKPIYIQTQTNILTEIERQPDR